MRRQESRKLRMYITMGVIGRVGVKQLEKTRNKQVYRHSAQSESVYILTSMELKCHTLNVEK